MLEKLHTRTWEAVRKSNWIYRAMFKFGLGYKRMWLYRGANTPLVNAVVMRSVRYSLGGGGLKSVLSGGAPLSSKTQEFLKLTLCCPVIQGYGLTETCGAGLISYLDDLSSGHVGGPLPSTRVRLVCWDEGGYSSTDLSGPKGEIWLGGPCVATGFYKNPERTEEEFHIREGIRWYATGDIGRIRWDGTIVIIDRMKDIVKIQSGVHISLGECLLLFFQIRIQVTRSSVAC